jgi:xanthine dehydrogenase YagT iron-sulfur-binding subunit
VSTETVLDVQLTVNGTPVTLRLPARTTLADALRDHLRLTGTHLGCEHGVCGMCTVLVDGEAARACLLFAVQLDGSEIVTVEGLGTPDDQHPLQEAFSRHHALQCGFCTPGFLMSSYDLLAAPGERNKDELPQDLSGVLCRCTGYRNILAAVTDVAGAYPDGVPGPRNCGGHALLQQGSGTVPEQSDEAPVPDEALPDLVMPTGTPTATVSVTSELSAPVSDVWRVLDDAELLARCLPGAELTEELGEDRYRGKATVALGPIRLSFAGLAQITERDPDAHRLRVLAHGTDAGGGQTQADIRLVADPSGEGTRLRAEADIHLTGRIAQFGRALAGDVSKRLFEQFADSVAAAATSGTVPVQRLSPGRILGATVAARARAALGRVRDVLRRRRR